MADDQGGFLGGGPQFNKVGAPAPTDGSELDTQTSQSLQPHQIRYIAIAVVIVVMLGILFFISDPGGVIHKAGRGGHEQEKPTAPSNF